MRKTHTLNRLATNNSHTLSVKASTKQIAKVRDFVADHASNFGFKPKEVEDIRLAVDEAFTNIIKHAYNYDESKEVQVRLDTDGNDFKIVLLDEGKAFDTTKYSLPDVKEQIKARKRGGVGVYLIKQLMDDVEYARRRQINEIRMTKKKKSSSNS